MASKSKRQCTIVVPGSQPPSVNNYVRHTRKGQHYKTDEAKEWENRFRFYQGRVFPDSINWKIRKSVVWISVFLGDSAKGDIDNFGKVCLDCLVRGGVLKSDAGVITLEIRKHRDRQNPRTEITVTEL